MNGVRTLREADERPMLLCPVCRAKLCWNLGLEPLARYGMLIPALAKAGLAGTEAETRKAAALTRPGKP